MKIPVCSTVFVKPDGSKRPMSIIGEDNRVFKIDHLLDVQKLSPLEGGCFGARYTVMIRGKRSVLFEEDGLWSVETGA